MRGVAVAAERHRLDRLRAVADPGAVDRLADDLVDGQRVGPVHALARDAPAAADALRDRRIDHLA